MSGPLRNAKHEAFVQRIALLEDAGPAYAKVYRVKKPEVAASCGNRLLQNAEVAARLAELQTATATSTTLTAIERREFLARVVRADITKLDFEKDGDLLQEKTVTTTEDRETVKYKLPGKRECVMADAELAGDLKLIERGQINVNVGVQVNIISEDQRAKIMELRRVATAGAN